MEQRQLTGQEVLDRQVAQSQFMSKVYGWMMLGLLITAITGAFFVYSGLFVEIASRPILFYGLLIAEFIVVIALSARVHKMPTGIAIGAFGLYSILNGATLSVYLMIFTGASIASTFAITAVTFGIMSVYGYVTKTDLSKVRNILYMGILGIIVASLFNIFMKSEFIYWAVTYLGIIIFIALVAYDTQKIKRIYSSVGPESATKASIMGALVLYLDFVNLFLFLLRLFGRRR